MSNNKSEMGKKIAIGSAVAAVVGYAAGILTAPKSGKDTRRDIKNKAGEVKVETGEQLQKVHDELSEALKTARTKTSNLSDKAKSEFNEAVIRAKDAQSKASTVLKSVKAGKADDPSLNKAIKQGQLAKKNLGKFLRG